MRAIEFDGVGFAYESDDVLSDLSFGAEAGCLTALLGPNGAGKSTVFNLVAGLLLPDRGDIRVDGASLTSDPLAARRKVGAVFQETTLDRELSVRRNIDYFCGLHGLADVADRREELLRRFGVGEEQAGRPVAALSGGMRRRVEIARALLGNPSILVLDEPTAGLDPESKSVISEHVRGLCAGGVSVFWITHLLDELADDDAVVVLAAGRVAETGSFKSLGGAEGCAARYRSAVREAL